MSKVQHVSAAEYKVEGSEACYTVDLAVGMCSCPVGDTGALCKHQLAASQTESQFSAVKLPQLFGCSPADKCLLSKIVYGDKSSYDANFFAKLGEDVQQTTALELANDQASGNEQSHGSMQVRGIQVETVVEEEDVIEQASGSESYEHRVSEYIKTLTEKLNAFKSEATH